MKNRRESLKKQRRIWYNNNRNGQQAAARMKSLSLRASQGFDRGLAAGEAIRRLMRQIANLNTNAEDNLAYAA